MEWRPINTAPANQSILTYADWDSEPIGVSRFRIDKVIEGHVEHESTNAKGKRTIIQELTIDQRTWSGAHWEPTHWMPLPEPPSE